MGDIEIKRVWAMPNQWTFEIDEIRDLIETEVNNNDGLWIDPFCGKSDIADITNDLNEDRDADYHLPAKEFLERFDDREVDGGVIFDPPYSLRQIKECYEDCGVDDWYEDNATGAYSDVKDEISRVMSKGARVISFGWNSSGVGRKSDGFRKKKILLVCHGGAHNDTICVVEEKVQKDVDIDSVFDSVDDEEEGISDVGDSSMSVSDTEDSRCLNKIDIVELDERDHRKSGFNNAFNSSFTYTASYPSAIPGTLINMYTDYGDVVLDPFSGRGTAPLQALQMDRVGIANDLSPVAYTYCRAVTNPIDLSMLDDIFDRLEDEIHNVRVNPYGWQELLQLYEFDTLRDILALRKLLVEDRIFDDKICDFLNAYMMSILIGSGDDSLLPLSLFVNNANSLTAILGVMRDAERRKEEGEKDFTMVERSDKDVLRCLREKIDKSTKSGVPRRCGDVYNWDAAKLSEKIDKDVDLVVTSPPYADVVTYGKTNFLSFWYLGEYHDEYDEETEDKGSCSGDYDEFFGFMKEHLKDMYKVTADDAYLAYVIGGSQVDDELGVLHLPRKLALISEDIGFEPDTLYIEEYQGSIQSAGDGSKKLHRDGIVVLKKGDPDQYMTWDEAYATGIEKESSIDDAFDSLGDD